MPTILSNCNFKVWLCIAKKSARGKKRNADEEDGDGSSTSETNDDEMSL
jgi:hypothetical protein